MRLILTRAAGVLASVALLTVLTACQPAAPSGERPTGLPANGAPASGVSRASLPATRGSLPASRDSLPAPGGGVSVPPVGAGEGGAGSLTVAITEPVTFTGHVDTTVSCATANHTYTAAASSATIGGYQVAFTARVSLYKGPGTYPAIVTLDITGVTSGTVPGVPTTVTSTGGSFAIKATGENGRTVDVTLQWACS